MADTSRTHAACLLVGNLNPAIITPQWLAKQGVVPDGETILSMPLGLPFGALPSFELGGYAWACTLGNLEIVAKAAGADPGKAMALVLERLSHTPVRAVGTNFHYEWAAPAPAIDRLLASPLGSALGQVLPRVGQELTVRLEHRSSVLNVTVGSLDDPKRAMVRFNFHRVASTAADAGKAAIKWADDRADAESILERIRGS